MRQLQRAVLILLGILIILIAAEREQAQYRYFLSSWQEAQIALFFEHICREGCCSLNDYTGFCQTLSMTGKSEEIFLEEVKKERTESGKEYRYLISWQEIKEILQEEGSYHFQKESEVCLYACGKWHYGKALLWEK